MSTKWVWPAAVADAACIIAFCAIGRRSHAEGVTVNNPFPTALQLRAEAAIDRVLAEQEAASGSFRSLGMLVAPCSIRSLSEIASGVTSGLLSRAADVALKERRRVVRALR